MRRLSFEERRSELLDAAVRVIGRDGLAAATTRAIVAEADMPLGAFHYVFASRDDLLVAVIDHVTEQERLAAWIDAGADENTDPADADAPTPGVAEILTRGLDGYLRLLVSAPERELALLDVAAHAMRHDPAAVERQWQTYRIAARASLEYAADLARITWTLPLDDLAWSLASCLDGLTLSWLTARDADAARTHIRFLAAAFAAHAIPRKETPDAD
ncbi:TetR family transcriptional regulator [Microbacterium sp. NPDC089189]|uniref:TetR/AcrR family transcriptional regulator n=1 Tax=Microbacterium sp. NPDC089189 TaxID=3154972 RepID=UPI00341DC3B4